MLLAQEPSHIVRQYVRTKEYGTRIGKFYRTRSWLGFEHENAYVSSDRLLIHPESYPDPKNSFNPRERKRERWRKSCCCCGELFRHGCWFRVDTRIQQLYNPTTLTLYASLSIYRKCNKSRFENHATKAAEEEALEPEKSQTEPSSEASQR